MAAQAGKDLLVKLDDGTGNFIAVAGLRTRQMTFNANVIDITNQDSAGRWREILACGGVRRATLTGSGIFRDANSDATIRQIFFDSAVRNFQLNIPNLNLLEGTYDLIASLTDHSETHVFDEWEQGVRFDVRQERHVEEGLIGLLNLGTVWSYLD